MADRRRSIKKIIATYQKINGTHREVIIDVPEVKSLYPPERQFKLCEDYVKLVQKDDEHSHQVLVKELDLTEEFCKSSYQEFLSKEENPLTPINKIHSYIKKFMRNHEGFSRDNIQDWMNSISFIINDPENSLCILQTRLRYRI